MPREYATDTKPAYAVVCQRSLLQGAESKVKVQSAIYRSK